MDIPKTTQSQIDSEPELDPVLAPSGSVPWSTFTGKPGESASAFILSVQRIAFRQDRDSDDAWLADYASTCFDEEALYWYIGQDEESKGSWRKLRSSLLSRYGARSANAATHPPTPSLFRSAPSSSRLTTAHTESTGQIEVVGHYTEPLGYLSFDHQSGAAITADQTQALRVTLPTTQSRPILQICMSGPHAESLFPYLGLALISSSPGDQNCVSDPLKGVSVLSNDRYNSTWYPWTELDVSTPRGRLSYVPLLSSKCQNYEAYRSTPTFPFPQAEIATWVLSGCKKSRTAALYRRKSDTETPGQRGAAAVWKYDDQTEELRMYWVMDDDSECEVGAYVHRDTSDQIHVHRLIDMEPQKLGPYPGEDRVRLVFRHIH